jgi:hypothetical protein
LGDFFAHQDDVRVAGEFFIKAFTEGFTVGENDGMEMVKMDDR